MMKIIQSFNELNFRMLADVYLQSCQQSGKQNYPDYPPAQQILLAEQDLYGDVKCFFEDKNAFYAVWELEGRYVSVLRMEPYKDGLLLEGLETAPEERGNGYAKLLLQSVLSNLSTQEIPVIYSHIDKKNTPSLAVHIACGFEKIGDCAVYTDGSVSHNAYTMRK